jgi:Sigma-70 region 2
MIAEASSREAMLAAMAKLRASAISLCRNGDHAEDLVQETLLHACANITSFKPRVGLTEAKAMLPPNIPITSGVTLRSTCTAPAWLNMVSKNDGSHKVVLCMA